MCTASRSESEILTTDVFTEDPTSLKTTAKKLERLLTNLAGDPTRDGNTTATKKERKEGVFVVVSCG